ncbi:carbohydrate sulfotransferase 11 [Ceratina calcarata]|uniref:Carbohydrate sulfotransferase n=1 Tax=Ceratina calcarata TaxID=156304 RepID=A0AAJ7NEE5_9HYME|nr:carbohydrate sulfotransferase 11 [Ceratina calcarata]
MSSVLFVRSVGCVTCFFYWYTYTTDSNRGTICAAFHPWLVRIKPEEWTELARRHSEFYARVAIDASLNPDTRAYMSTQIRYEYRRKIVHREKMTPRRYVFAAIKRTLLAGGLLTLLVLALSSQDTGNSVQQGLLSEEDSNLTPEERLMEEAAFAETEKRLYSRKKFLAQKCAEEELDRPGNDSLHKPNAWEFLVNREYHLIWCNVFKAASTSWMYNFNLLAGYSPQFLKASKAVPVSLARQKYPRHTAEELSKFLNDSISFLIVRHPFERLLSAYRDKLEHSLPHTFHSNLGTHIVWNYRTKTAGRHGPRYPLFEEFVRWLLCQWKAGNELDMHWTPIVTFCTPCQVRFDVIAKFETLHEDQDYLIKRAQVGNIIKPEWKNPTRGVQTKDVIKNYFAQLSKLQINDLYEMFRYDFVLFDYSPDDYIALGRDEETELICKK